MTRHRLRLILLVAVVVAITACATGSAIVTGTKRTPTTSDQVRLYIEAPAEFEVIGLVSASSDGGWSEQDSVDYAIKELKSQAAKLGANGLILSPSVDTTTTVVGRIPVATKTVQGKAIFVKGQ